MSGSSKPKAKLLPSKMDKGLFFYTKMVPADMREMKSPKQHFINEVIKAGNAPPDSHFHVCKSVSDVTYFFSKVGILKKKKKGVVLLLVAPDPKSVRSGSPPSSAATSSRAVSMAREAATVRW